MPPLNLRWWLLLALASLAAPSLALAGPEKAWRRFDSDVHFQAKVHRTFGFVRGIAQTADGYLWFATSFGVARYDGVRFDFFDSSNTPAFTDDHVSGLIKARDGSLWIAMERAGLLRYAEGRFSPVPIANVSTNAELCCIAEDNEGGIWAGTVQKGLHRFAEGQWQHFEQAARGINKIWKTPDGNLLISTSSGYFRTQRGQLIPVPPEQYAGGRPEEASFVLRNILPASAPPFEASVYDKVRGRTFDSATVAADGAIWLGINGITRIQGQSARVFSIDDGVASEDVLSVFEDREGNIWAGHHGTGLTQLSRVPFFSFLGHDGFAGGAAFSLAETRDGAIWISHVNGLTEVRGEQFRNWSASLLHPLWAARSLLADPNGSLWMILQDEGIGHLVGEALTVYPFPGQSDGRSASALALSEDGVMWTAASDGGLLKFKQGRWEDVPVPALGGVGCAEHITVEHPCPQSINVIVPRKRGGLWLGTQQKGLWKREADGHLQQSAGGALAEATVFTIVEVQARGSEQEHKQANKQVDSQDKQDHVWVGTNRGLFFLTSGRIAHFTRKQGLISDGVFALLDDGAGNFWIGSDRGIYRVPQRQLFAVIDGTATTVDPVSYRALDGLPSDEIIRRFEPTALRSRDGRLWFAAVAGVAVFQTPAQMPKLAPPEARLERVVLKRQVFTPPWQRVPVEIKPGSGDLEFHYTAPVFGAPHRIRFRYRLEGFDSEWINAEGRRAAYYTNLPPGPYTFRVMADSAESGPSAVTASFAFVLQPAFHETVWFYLVLAAAVLLIGVTVQALRIRAVKAKFSAVLAERNRIARDLHDTLAQVFSAIGFQIDSAMGLAGPEPRLLKDRLKRVRQMVAHARLAARNVIWNLRHAEADESSVPSLVAKLEAIPPLYDSARIVVTVTGDQRPIPAAVENEVFHITQEAVSNAVEHGKAGLISIEVEVSATRLELWVHDNGVGFKPTSAQGPEPRFGLRGMRERARSIGAELTMHAEPDVGTEIGVAVPLPPPRASSGKGTRTNTS